MANNGKPLPDGIISVIQTPFREDGRIDYRSLGAIIEDAVAGGVKGFLAPAVASESTCLSLEERCSLVKSTLEVAGDRVPLVVGASSDVVAECRHLGTLATDLGAKAWLVAVPQALYGEQSRVPGFFRRVSEGIELPLVVQDMQFNGPGLDLEVIRELGESLPGLIGMKIETQPAGPKYTAVRQIMGDGFFIAGGWAVPQMIEALDRGINAMIPESSMVRAYSCIFELYRNGRREEAIEVFRRLLPILVFSNQDLATSIAFFKRLLVRRGVFRSPYMRLPGFEWDEYNSRVADELIDCYLDLESGLGTIRL